MGFNNNDIVINALRNNQKLKKMAQVLGKQRQLGPEKLVRTIYWLIAFFWSFIIIMVAVQFLTKAAAPSPFEITKDLIFVATFSISLIYLYNQLNDNYTSQERAYIKLFKKNPHPMWVYDLKTLQFLTVNDAAISLYGYSEAEFLNMTIKDMRLDEDVPALIDETEKIKLNFNLNYHWAGTWRHRMKNDQLMYVEISSHEIIFEGKKAELVLAYDVTGKVNQESKLQTLKRDLERKVMKRTDDLLQLNTKLVDQNKIIKSANLELYNMTCQLQEANEKIREQTDLKNKFISMASHEFRVPLASIKSAAEFLKRYLQQASQEEIIDEIERIEKQIINLTFLLDDVLTIGKTDSIKIAVKVAPMNIRDFINRITHDVQCSVNYSSHKIQLSIDEKVPETINSDEKLMRNIFINLLTNAIKYSPGRDFIYFDIFSTDKGVGFRVKDEGVGMSSTEMPKIFESFYRIESTKSIPGTGLGLAIVKKAAELINAKISVESEVNKGSVFSVMLST